MTSSFLLLLVLLLCRKIASLTRKEKTMLTRLTLLGCAPLAYFGSGDAAATPFLRGTPTTQVFTSTGPYIQIVYTFDRYVDIRFPLDDQAYSRKIYSRFCMTQLILPGGTGMICMNLHVFPDLHCECRFCTTTSGSGRRGTR